MSGAQPGGSGRSVSIRSQGVCGDHLSESTGATRSREHESYGTRGRTTQDKGIVLSATKTQRYHSTYINVYSVRYEEGGCESSRSRFTIGLN